MRLLKENYEDLHEFGNLPKELKDILLEPDIQKALARSDLEYIYNKYKSSIISFDLK